MKAEEARQLAENSIGNKQAYEKIMHLIHVAASQGKYEIFYYESINDHTRKKLSEDGYKVGKPIFDRNETLVNISWRHNTI
jgi:hypothetical protein